MVINFGNMQEQMQNNGFMELCVAHPECVDCELSDGSPHEVNGVVIVCNTAQVENNQQ